MIISVIPAIESLKIRNFGVIRKADFKFTKGINVISGGGGSGKTTVINAINHLLKGEKLIYGASREKKSSEKALIAVELLKNKLRAEGMTKQKSVYEECFLKRSLPNKKPFPQFVENSEQLKNRLSHGENTILEITTAVRTACKGQAILLDGVFEQLDRENREFLWKLFRKSGLQVITTGLLHSQSIKTHMIRPLSI